MEENGFVAGALAALMMVAASPSAFADSFRPPTEQTTAIVSGDVRTEYAQRHGGRRAVHARGHVHRGTAVRRNVVVNRHVNVVRPVRRWVRRPYYGRVVGGVALGSLITAAAVGSAPQAPAPNLCWYWADTQRVRGYWDYCQAP